MTKSKKHLHLTILIIFSILLSACDNSSETQSVDFSQLKVDEVIKDPSGWPRTLMTSKGPVTLQEPPKKIVSTSITITGTLLALDAPIIGSAATIPNTNISDDKGFFIQWSEVAKAKELKVLYQTEHNAEAVIKANPDLIFIAATSGDSALKLYDQLKDIAPTVVINHGNKSWTQLSKVLGRFIGLENNAISLVTEFDSNVNEFKKLATLPPQPTTPMVYYQDGTGANIFTSESAQGQLLSSLGFTLAPIPDSVRGNLSMGKRNDIVIVGGENFPDALTGNSLLLFAAEPPQVNKIKNNNYLKETPAIKGSAVYAVGNDTFRLDYFSASNLITRLTTLFANNHEEMTSHLEQ
jgi:iron complex transport system substrate-binding protein